MIENNTRLVRLINETAKFTCDLDEGGKISARLDPISGDLHVTDISDPADPRRLSLGMLEWTRLAGLFNVALEAV